MGSWMTKNVREICCRLKNDAQSGCPYCRSTRFSTVLLLQYYSYYLQTCVSFSRWLAGSLSLAGLVSRAAVARLERSGSRANISTHRTPAVRIIASTTAQRTRTATEYASYLDLDLVDLGDADSCASRVNESWATRAAAAATMQAVALGTETAGRLQ